VEEDYGLRLNIENREEKDEETERETRS